MKLYGVDFGGKTDQMTFVELAKLGDYKAPIPQNVTIHFIKSRKLGTTEFLLESKKQ